MKQRGSLTIFAALSLMLVAQLLFTLLEGARFIEFRKVTHMNTDSVLESVFADYCTPLWETYHLLGFSVSDQEGEFSFTNREAQIRELSENNLGRKGTSAGYTGMSLLSVQMTDASFEPYLIMSDQGGRVFEEAVCTYMKKNLTSEAIKSLYSNYEAVQEIQKNYGDGDERIKDAMDALDSPEKQEDVPKPKATLKGASKTKQSVEQQENSTENPLETVTECKKRGTLSMVLPEQSKISQKRLALDGVVSKRKLQQGNGRTISQQNPAKKILLNQYFINYMTCFTDAGENRALDYELEYLLAGREEDSENLRRVVDELLLIREALNMASLIGSPEKQEEAAALAVAIAGVTVNPVIIEVVKYGILAAWAFTESVLDLRTLLSGGKIALLKTGAEWTSNIQNIPELLSGWSVAKDCPMGLDYSGCLGLLLMLRNSEKSSLRAMDVEEATVRQNPGYENFKMDQLICEAQVSVRYEYKPVFLGFVTMLKNTGGGFCLQNKSAYSYLQDGKGGV